MKSATWVGIQESTATQQLRDDLRAAGLDDGDTAEIIETDPGVPS